MKRKLLMLVLLTVISIGLSSCGVWYNFKAYFNSYYNAKVLFDQVETNLEKQPKELFSFFEMTIPAQDYLSLNKVVEKCSKILQFDTRSSYFIDALWLSGKSFYYQKEFVKAERKFKELLSNVKEQDELLNVNLWLGKTELQLRNFEEGIKILSQVADDAIKLEEDEIFSEAVIKQIAFLIYKERFPEAIERCTKFLGNSSNKEINAEVAYELGKFYYKNNDYQKASDAFKLVSTFSPTFETEYKSKLEYAKCLIDLGKIDDGMSILEDMKNKSQYIQYLDEILLEIGTGHYLKKEFPQAMDLFSKVDTVYYGNKSAGIAEYMKAQIYEYHLPDFDSSLYYYDLANQNANLADDMKLQIGRKMGVMLNYINYRNEIKLVKKGIEYAADKQNYLRDSLLYVDAIYKDTTEQRKRMTAMQMNAQFPGQGQPGQTQGQFGQNQGQMGQQQGQMGQQQQIGQMQGVDRETYQGQQASAAQQSANAMAQQQSGTNQNYTAQQQPKLALSGSTQPTNTMGGRKIQRVPKKKPQPVRPVMPTIKLDSLQTNLSTKLYSFANLFFNDLELPDSAAYYYKSILTEFPKKPIVPNAFYALGTYYLTVNKKEKADSLFKIVYNDYKSSSVNLQAAKKLGLIEEVPKTDPADSLYLAAEKKYYNKNYTEAISDYRNIIAKFPKSKLAPKSAYYIAFIFENDIKNIDSTTAAYEYLNQAFPTSDAAAAGMKRHLVYQEEKVNKQKAKDALKKPAQQAVVPPVKPVIKDSVKIFQDSIRVMMQKSLMKDSILEKQKRKADSLNAVREKLKERI